MPPCDAHPGRPLNDGEGPLALGIRHCKLEVVDDAFLPPPMLSRLVHNKAAPHQRGTTRVQQTQRRGLGLQAVWVGCHVRRKREEEGAGGPNQGLPSLLLDGDEDDEHGLGERESVHVGQVAGGRHHVDEHDLVHIDREYDRKRDGEPRVDGVPCEEEGQK